MPYFRRPGHILHLYYIAHNYAILTCMYVCLYVHSYVCMYISIYVCIHEIYTQLCICMITYYTPVGCLQE